LISQQFYDVESVLLSGALGSTNTAVSIIIGLLLMIFGVLVVLIRRGNAKDEEWDEEEFYDDDDENDVDSPSAESEETESGVDAETTTYTSTHSEPEIANDLRRELAAKAGQVGVMQAAPATNQGETGWYVDASTELQYWNVGEDGSWTRIQ
jgi:hypothetical protein